MHIRERRSLIKYNYFFLFMNNNGSKAPISKERAFLFLSIIIVITLLTGFPENLKVFVTGTAGAITGGATAVENVELKDYFIGLVIFAVLLVFLGYLVHALRTPKPQKWYPQIIDEDKFSSGIDKNRPLENNLEQVNKELKNLRQAKEDTSEVPKKKAKKITKVPNVEKIHLEHTLRNINAQLHNHTKTSLIMEAPPAKSKWDNSLEQVKQELASVDKMKLKKAKVLDRVPAMKDINSRQENQKIREKWKASLSKVKKNVTPIIVLEEPARKKRWNKHLENVNQELESVDKMPVKKVSIRERIPSITKTQQNLELKQDQKISSEKRKSA